jgi:hypothetical protein
MFRCLFLLRLHCLPNAGDRVRLGVPGGNARQVDHRDRGMWTAGVLPNARRGAKARTERPAGGPTQERAQEREMAWEKTETEMAWEKTGI